MRQLKPTGELPLSPPLAGTRPCLALPCESSLRLWGFHRFAAISPWWAVIEVAWPQVPSWSGREHCMAGEGFQGFLRPLLGSFHGNPRGEAEGKFHVPSVEFRGLVPDFSIPPPPAGLGGMRTWKTALAVIGAGARGRSCWEKTPSSVRVICRLGKTQQAGDRLGRRESKGDTRCTEPKCCESNVPQPGRASVPRPVRCDGMLLFPRRLD